MFKLLRFLKGHRIEAFLAPLFKLLEAIFELLVPLFVASLIDRGIQNGDMHHILMMVLYMILMGFGGLAVATIAQWFSSKVASSFAHNMKSELFSHINTLSLDEREKIGSSTLITRLTSDSNQVQNAVNMFLRLFLRSPFIVLGALFMSFMVDRRLSLIFLSVIPILSLIVFLIMRKTVPMFKRVQERLDRVVLRTRENLAGVRVLRAYSKEESEMREFSEELENMKALQTSSGHFGALLNPLTMVIVNLGVVLIIFFGNRLYSLNLIEIGSVVALVNYMNQILTELVKFANLIITLSRGVASGNRIEEVFEIESSIKSGDEKGEKESKYIVEFENVGLSYGGGKPAIKDIDLRFRPGEKIGIIGGTGSGKSSLVSLIARLYDPTQGRVTLFGCDLREWNTESLRKKIGFVPQKAQLFKGTIRENLKWGCENASDEEIIRALQKSEAYDFVFQKEKGLSYEIDSGGKNLSGGQRQRLTIARALLRDPEILILDDSSSALDYLTDSKLRKTILKMDGVTVFAVSQRASSLIGMDRIIVMDEGRIIDVGTHESLLESSPVYREIYNSQFGEGESV